MKNTIHAEKQKKNTLIETDPEMIHMLMDMIELKRQGVYNSYYVLKGLKENSITIEKR